MSKQRGAAAAELQKIISLFFVDWFFEPLEHLHHVFPDFPFLGGRLVPQQVGGMIGDHQRHAVV